MKVTITSQTEERLWSFHEAVTTEIGGFGYASREDDGSLLWSEVFLVPQEVSGGKVEFDAAGLAFAIERAATDGKLDDERFVWVSWHSHNSMDAFWSSTDENCIRTYGDTGVLSLLSFVGNHDHDYKMRFDAFDVEHDGFVIPHVTMDSLELTCPRFDAIEEELKHNVKVFKSPKMVPVNGTRKSDPGDTLSKALTRVEDNGFEIHGWDSFDGFDTQAWEALDVLP